MHYRRKYIRLAVAALLTGIVLALVASAGITGQSRTALDTGDGRLEVVDGVTVVTLAGSPREMGRQHGILLGDRMLESEAAFRHIMPQIPGGAFGEWLLKIYVMFRLDGIEEHLTDAELDEMKGMAETGPDKDRDYRDLLYYHVLQDIGQNYACTGAAVCGSRSSLQGPVAGRNFDLNKDGVLDPLKTVFVYVPDEGKPYATVAWPGMTGAVSGMNGYGLCVMVFSARTEGTSMSGVPVAFIARRVLASAKDVDDAVGLISSTPRMGSNVFLVADTRRAAAVEFDAYRVAVREVKNGVLPVANHMLCEEFLSDEKNVRQKKYSDSRQRLDRVEQVLLKKRKAGPEEMLAALRDHSGP
ncbi:MAG TPA: C45 family peptidase, partial [Nitrospirota bacterium]